MAQKGLETQLIKSKSNISTICDIFQDQSGKLIFIIYQKYYKI